MEFQIIRETASVPVPIGPGVKGVRFEDREAFTWALVKSDGEHVAHGPRVFYDEKSCRSQIATAKKSMKGAMRCKVVTRS